MAASGGEEERVSMDDSDRENFRRRDRSPASKRGGGHERGRERTAQDEHDFERISERGGKIRRGRSPAASDRGGSREREQSEQEFGRGLERRDNGRRERSPGSIAGGSTHDRERDEGNRPARRSGWEDDGRRREKSPSSRRRGGVSSRDRERSERGYGRVSDKRDEWRRDRKPRSTRGGSRERESRYARGSDRGGNARRERRGDSKERGHGQDDFGRGGYGRRDYSRRERNPSPRVTDYREKDQDEDEERPREGFEAGDSRKRDRSPVSHDGNLEKEFEARDRNSDVDSLQGIKRVKEDSLSPREEQDIDNTIKQGKDGREITEAERKRRPQALMAREETSDSGTGQRKSGDEDGSDVGGDSEQNGEGKVQVLSKIARENRRNATSEDDGGGNLEGRVRGGRRLEVENGFSGEESEEDEESDGDRKSRKRKPRKREKEKHARKHRKRSHSRGKKRKHRRRYTSSDEATSESDSASSSNSEISESEDSEQREKARKQRRKRRRKEKEREMDREMKRKMKRKKRELKEKKLRAELKKKKKEMRSKKPITTSWGKYGILKDIDMWNKKPEFGAWLAEVKKVNIETLTNWEEKQMFKEYMEDYNTATFPSKKYYNVDDYLRRKVAKARMKGIAQALNVERTDFNDEDDRRLELQKEREKQKEADVQDLMRKMQGGMAQDMREQAQLREEMQYQFRLGNTEAAQAIQRRLDPDADKFTK